MNAIIPIGGNMALLDDVTAEQMAEVLGNIRAQSEEKPDDPNDPKETFDFIVNGSVVYSAQAAGTFGNWLSSNPKFEEVTADSGLWTGPTVDLPNIRRFAIFSNQNPLNAWQLIGVWDTESEEILDVLTLDPSVQKN